MKFSFDNMHKNKIIDRFGLDFFNRVEALIEPFTIKWQIDELQLLDSFSASLVFKGRSKTYGPIIVKFGIDHEAFESEVKALKFFGENSACRLYDADLDNMVLLEEALEPGTTLFSENDIEKRLKVFCELFKSLHYDDGRSKESTHNSVAIYQHQSYSDWITKITEYMESKSSWAEITTHMKRAKARYMEILDQYPDQTLLHGDFHYYNILKTQKGYKIIDPKGVLGHPIFDIPRYVLNEYWDEKDTLKVDATVEKVLTVLSSQLDISKGLLSRLMYIEGAMAMCWCVEDGMSIDDKESVLESLGQLYRYTV